MPWARPPVPSSTPAISAARAEIQSAFVVDSYDDFEVRDMRVGEIYGDHTVSESDPQFIAIKAKKQILELLFGGVGVLEHSRVIRT